MQIVFTPIGMGRNKLGCTDRDRGTASKENALSYGIRERVRQDLRRERDGLDHSVGHRRRYRVVGQHRHEEAAILIAILRALGIFK
jgi:hypothetical protein